MRWRSMFTIIVIIKSINDLVMSKTKVGVDSGLITMPSNDIMIVWSNKWQVVVWSNPPTFHFSFHFTNHDSNWVSNVHPCLITTQLYLGIWLCYHLIWQGEVWGARAKCWPSSQFVTECVCNQSSRNQSFDLKRVVWADNIFYSILPEPSWIRLNNPVCYYSISCNVK